MELASRDGAKLGEVGRTQVFYAFGPNSTLLNLQVIDMSNNLLFLRFLPLPSILCRVRVRARVGACVCARA